MKMRKGVRRFQDGGMNVPNFNPVGQTAAAQQAAAQQAAAANPGGGTAAQYLGMMGLGINPATGMSGSGPGLQPGGAPRSGMMAPPPGAQWTPGSGPGGGGPQGAAYLGAMPPGAGSMQASPQQMQAMGAQAPTAATMQGMTPSPQQLAAMQQFRQRQQPPQAMAGAGGPGGAGGAMPGAAGPMMRPGGGPPPGAGGQAMMQGVPGGMPRPGMGGMQGGPPPGPPPGMGQMGPMFGAAPGGAPAAGGGGAGLFGAAPGAAQANPQMNPQLAAMLAQQGGMMGMAKGGRVKTFNSTKAAPGNLATKPGKGKMAEGGEVGMGGADEFDSLPEKKAKGGVAKEKSVLRKKPHAAEKKARDIKDVPSYDKPDAGDDGWPPTPRFTSAPGANDVPPVPSASPISPTPVGPPGMKKGGECVADKDGDKMRKGGSCDKMAAGGAAKVRRGFPDTIKPGGKSKMKFAKGGGVRGAGAAQRGTNFSGIY